MTVALIIDVDGVVSPLQPTRATWGDEVSAGTLFSTVYVSPQLCSELDDLAETAGVEAAWLTSWDAQMRAAMHPWPGRTWPEIELGPVKGVGGWLKREALEEWLRDRSHVTAVVWCDDDLAAPARQTAIRRRLTQRGLDALLIAPDPQVGLAPTDLAQIRAWVKRRGQPDLPPTRIAHVQQRQPSRPNSDD